MNNILRSTQYVVNNSDFVSLNKVAINNYAERFISNELKPWFLDAPLKISKLREIDQVHFMVLFSALSFSYWGNPNWTVEYDNQISGGSWGLILALKRALDEDIPVFDAEYLATVSIDDVRQILRGSTEIPMIHERQFAMNDVGKVLTVKYEGDFRNLLSQSNDVNILRKKIVSEIKSFQDSSQFKGETIYFHKRAQIILAGVAALLPKTSCTKFKNIHELTTLADYRIPQILKNMEIIEYTDELAQKIEGQVELDAGSPEETEIRANTIWAVELIRDELNKAHGTKFLANDINDYLWLETQQEGFDKRIHHRVRTTAY